MFHECAMALLPSMSQVFSEHWQMRPQFNAVNSCLHLLRPGRLSASEGRRTVLVSCCSFGERLVVPASTSEEGRVKKTLMG